MITRDLQKIFHALKAGELIAYPTEAVYGLGCDPWNEAALQKLVALKNRSEKKGFIIIAARFKQLENFIEKIPEKNLEAVLKTWPGPVTWIFPAKKNVSHLITGEHNSIAVRVSAHPIVQAVCSAFGAIVSTSANVSGEMPGKTAEQVRDFFSEDPIEIYDGAVGTLAKPTPIFDALSGEQFR